MPLIVSLAIGLMIGWVISIFNKLIRNSNRTKNALSDIDVQLKRRYDLVGNLVETVKGYATHEASVFDKVTEARSAAMGAPHDALAVRALAETTLTGALHGLLGVAEAYPELQASENFKQLQQQLVTLEDDIQSARKYFNAAVREMNNNLQVFPASLVARVFGFKTSEFFGALENEKAAVEVSFSK